MWPVLIDRPESRKALAHDFAGAPCMDRPAMWDGRYRHESESVWRERAEWAADRCLTDCLHVSACRRVARAERYPTGVWAGLIFKNNPEGRNQ